MESTRLPLEGLIDSHFHLLEMRKQGLEPESILYDLHSQGLAGGLDVGISADDVAERSQLLAPCRTSASPQVSGRGGAQGEHEIEAEVIRFATSTTAFGIECIGEIGLDNYWHYGTPSRQRELFYPTT